MHRSFTFLFLLVIGFVATSPGEAEGLSRPKGTIILLITGDIEHRNSEEGALFDRTMLEALGVEALSTSSTWTDGVTEFEGVPARAVMDAVGARGDKVVAYALNDYSVEIPIGDFESYPVLFALRMNGRDLTVRDRGPIWIVYPRDDFPELRSEVINARWVWQLSRLVVE